MGGLFDKPKMPELPPPTPLPDEQQTTAARRRRIAQEKNTSGVGSTALSSATSEKLGA